MQALQRESVENGNARALFKHLDSRTATKLTQLGIEAHLEPGEFLFRANDESGQFYVITSGTIAIEQPGRERDVRIQTLHTGDFLGWSALLGAGTRHFQARAVTRVRVLTFDGELIRESCEADPRFGYELMRRLLFVATERLDATRLQIVEMQRGYVRDFASAAGA